MRVVLAGLTLAASASGCAGGHRDGAPAPAPVTVAWQAVELPAPPGAPGRVAVRDAAACDGTWWLVGGVFAPGATGECVPAGWTSSDDGRTWTALRFAARGYWARLAVLSSVACRGDRVVMVGAKSGGAHGNPRVSTWWRRPDGVFTDAVAPFELYGGPQAVSVGRVAAAPSTTPSSSAAWLVSGNRTAGAAVWTSTDERTFTLLDDDPALARDAEVDTFAADQVHDGATWTVVGNGALEGRVQRVPLAWTSADGLTWSRQEVPHGDGYADLERVVVDPDAGGSLLAVGLRDDGFGVWRRTGGAWRAEEPFGQVDPEGVAFTGVSGLVATADGAWAAVSDGSSYALWREVDGGPWRPVDVPVEPAAAGEQVLTVAASGGTVLLLADDGGTGRVWRAGAPE